MLTLRIIARRLRLLVRRRDFERDLEDEMRFHVEMQTARNVARGMSAAAARSLAEREFGFAERYKDEVRDVRGVTWMDDVRRDVRHGLRALRRVPGLVAIAVICLGLGIGANAAIFSVVDAVLLRPLPYFQPERLVYLQENFAGGGVGTVSYPNFLDWAAQTTAFDYMAAYSPTSLNLQGPDEPERVGAIAASADYFRVLGVAPLLGRTFTPGEDQPGHGNVAVLDEGLWRRRFGADRDIVGRTITLDGSPVTVIGVMPKTFGARTEVWVPLVATPALDTARGNHNLGVLARLKPGLSFEQGVAQLDRVAADLARRYPREQTGRGVKATPLSEITVASVRPALLVLLGAVALVLLIACANVANLLLARAATRRHEVAIRIALGASRARLVHQFLVESVLLALGGAVVGAVLARLCLTTLGTLAAGALPRASGIRLDATVFLFLLAVAVLCGIAFGIVPALHVTRSDVRGALIEGAAKTSAGRSQQRMRGALVVAEMALSLVLLIGAGLLLRGFALLLGTKPGLDARQVLTAHLAIPSGKYQPRDVRAKLLTPALDRVRAIPGVRSAGMISLLPIQQAWTNGDYQIVGKPRAEPGKEPWAEFRATSPQLFRSLGVPMLAGRDFTDQEAERGAKVAIVNHAFGQREFPGESPVGHELMFDDGTDGPYTIVGVVGDVRQAGLDRPPLPEINFLYGSPHVVGVGDLTLVVKTAVPPESVVPALRAAVRGVDPAQPVYQVLTMEEVIAQSLAGRRLNLWLLGVFAGVALVLSVAGLYGVIAYAVAQRTREIGIRMALGAQARDVVRLVVRHGAGLVALGIAIGIVGAAGLTRLLSSLLYGVSARDPATFAAVAVLLAAVALVATYLPARRAARVDPLLAIRNE